MNKKYFPFIGVGLVALLVLLGVVKMFGNSSTPSSSTTSPQPNKSAYDTEFPLPKSVSTFTRDASTLQVNFQTTLSVKEAEEFYRTELTKLNLTERTINTVATEQTFSMIFDGHASGKAVVVQGVDLSGKTNINIRFEQI